MSSSRAGIGRWLRLPRSRSALRNTMPTHRRRPMPSRSRSPPLPDDLSAVWAAPTTDARLKKRIVRAVIEEAVADLDDETSEIVLVLHWGRGAPHRASPSQAPTRTTKQRPSRARWRLCVSSP